MGRREGRELVGAIERTTAEAGGVPTLHKKKYIFLNCDREIDIAWRKSKQGRKRFFLWLLERNQREFLGYREEGVLVVGYRGACLTT